MNHLKRYAGIAGLWGTKAYMPKGCAKKRKAKRKAQRQARKRNRR